MVTARSSAAIGVALTIRPTAPDSLNFSQLRPLNFSRRLRTPLKLRRGGLAKPAVCSTPALVAKTPWGEPDLRGTYTTDNSIGIPF